MLNKERVKMLRDYIASEASEWDISSIFTCFIGQMHDALIANGIKEDFDNLETFLGIYPPMNDEDRNSNLVMPSGWSCKTNLYPRERAIRQLDHILETGVVDWSATPY